MKQILKWSLLLAAASFMAVWAGSLMLEVGKPDANAEAKNLHAALLARVTACQDPAKAMVTASFVQLHSGELQRVPLKVIPLHTVGTFAIVGDVPQGSAIDLVLTHPDYKNHQPSVLIRSNSHGVQWASLRRFFGTPPTDSDVKSYLETVD